MKRWLVKIAVLLAIGAILNVAVAWGFAVFHPPIIYSRDRSPLQGLYAWQSPQPNWEITYLPEAGTAHLRAHAQRSASTSVTRILVGPELPRWSRFRSGAQTAISLPIWTEMARGWPYYSMMNRVEEDTTTGQRIVHHAVRVRYGSPECALYFGPESFLPLYVIWRGFAINTIFYAAILWLLFVGTGRVRRWRRIKRRLCPNCAYPVGVSEVCTECGGRLMRERMGVPPPESPATPAPLALNADPNA